MWVCPQVRHFILQLLNKVYQRNIMNETVFSDLGGDSLA